MAFSVANLTRPDEQERHGPFASLVPGREAGQAAAVLGLAFITDLARPWPLGVMNPDKLPA